MTTLWTPFTLKNLTIRNRVVMAPTVKFCIDPPDGSVTDELVEHYRNRAASGTGLIIVEATAPTEGGKLSKNNLGLWKDEQIPGLARIAEAVHAEGAACFLQLCYCGLSTKDPDAEHTSASPEYYDFGGVAGVSHALTVPEIRMVEEAYRDAAVRAAKAGFDGVEIHCAHHKLYGHFLDAVTNHREDAYGGSYENRARIVTETIALIRQALPESFIIGIRIGCNMPDLENARGILQAIEKMPPDYYHLSKNIVAPEKDPALPADFPGNTVVYHGSLLKKELMKPVILSNGITLPEQAARLVEGGFGEMISLGRGMLADPDWTARAKAGEAVSACQHCKVCMWRKDRMLCPAAGGRL